MPTATISLARSKNQQRVVMRIAVNGENKNDEHLVEFEPDQAKIVADKLMQMAAEIEAEKKAKVLAFRFPPLSSDN